MEACYLIPILFLVGSELYWSYLTRLQDKEEQNVRVSNRDLSKKDDK